jgi:TonB family protein
MTATAFGYVVLITMLLAVVAASLEWAAQGRLASRHFWTGTIALALIAPPALFAWQASRRNSPDTVAASNQSANRLQTVVIESGGDGARILGHWISRDALIRLLLPGRSAIRARLQGVNRSFPALAPALWIAMSAAMIAWLLIGMVHWRRARRTWHRMDVDGIEVDVSHSTGPAVLGFFSHRIVLPEWVASMVDAHRRLVIAHESAHIDANDPERLAFGIAALIAMPWNPALWLCVARLRRAIELDCDARVLRRFPDAKEYGHVLLEVATRGRNTGPLAMPMVNLLRMPSELEVRLRAMTRPGRMGLRGAMLGAACALIAATTAFVTPVPHLIAKTSLPANTTKSDPISDFAHRAVFGATTLRFAEQHLGTRQNPTPSQAHRDSLQEINRAVAVRERALRDAENQLMTTRAELDRSRVLVRLRTAELDSAQRKLPAVPYKTYFEFQVDKPATILPGSRAPKYPSALRQAKVGGQVEVQFVVDTSGRIVPGTVKVTNATDPRFEASVRKALPTIRFSPAEVHGRRSKQLVQLPFTFSATKDPK